MTTKKSLVIKRHITGSVIGEFFYNKDGLLDLSRVNLSRANLSCADLSDANLKGVKNISPFLVCPEKGAFIGWKKLTTGVAEVLIPAKAKRVNMIGGRKCRASEVVVIKIHAKGKKVLCGDSPTHEETLTYRVGKRVKADKFDPDITKECTHGIHFFMTRKEAEDWR